MGAMCNKTAFFSLAEAQQALRRPQRSVRPWTTKVPVRAYECPQCKLWHLTAQPAFSGRI